ncbi:hypothetical protein [Acidithiobacillus sp. AMEEHan]|uniref:hypothetical protein n=1 Tax=Acidithiobacillus sp. AMEEHan TaxID=2994951 RepID=UPI0027E3F517|nr:hypothetical protein [Acidithiobacillus sp. AMEEHan]
MSPRGAVVDAGVPPQERVDELPLPEPLFYLHLRGFGQLPDHPELHQAMLRFATQAEFLRLLPRQSARNFLAAHPQPAIEENTLTVFFQVLFSEITRRMYLDAARQRPDAVGLRFTLAKAESASPAAQTIVTTDAHGLGAGVYPFTHVPENPDPGTENPFIIRILYRKDLEK